MNDFAFMDISYSFNYQINPSENYNYKIISFDGFALANKTE